MNLLSEKKKWICGCKGCDRYTNIRDIGINPVYFGPRFKRLFLDLRRSYYLCGKHYKLLNACKRVWGDFVGSEKFNEKYLDFEKAKTQLIRTKAPFLPL